MEHARASARHLRDRRGQCSPRLQPVLRSLVGCAAPAARFRRARACSRSRAARFHRSTAPTNCGTRQRRAASPHFSHASTCTTKIAISRVSTRHRISLPTCGLGLSRLATWRAPSTASTPGRQAFVRQLAWRDWYADLFVERPDLVDRTQQPQYDNIVWRSDPADVLAWKRGQTGYPIVDAAIRELAATGWMHNRLRLITASFFVKDLLTDWRIGERHFRHLLTDGDVPQNAGNWRGSPEPDPTRRRTSGC